MKRNFRNRVHVTMRRGSRMLRNAGPRNHWSFRRLPGFYRYR